MALIESTKIQLGSDLPKFTLPNTNNKNFSHTDLMGPKGLLVVFTCNHCPYAIAVWSRLITISKEAKKLGIETVAINPNINPKYPDDSPDKMKEKIKEWNIPFEYLIDKSQDVARNFDAQCTPDIYLYNSQQKLVYHGRIDDNWQDASKVTKEELKDAILNLSQGKEISKDQKTSMGCSIKWL